jgi:hypothetical protein
MVIQDKNDVINALETVALLNALAMRFLTTYKQYANGVGGITIPDEILSVEVKSPTDQNKRSVMAMCTVTYRDVVTHDVPVYRRNDYGYDSFSWQGGTEYTSVTKTEIKQQVILIPLATFTMIEPQVVEAVQTWARVDKQRLAEQARQQEISQLQARLRELTQNDNLPT